MSSLGRPRPQWRTRSCLLELQSDSIGVDHLDWPFASYLLWPTPYSFRRASGRPIDQWAGVTSSVFFLLMLEAHHANFSFRAR
jgi:hypothetical protein